MIPSPFDPNGAPSPTRIAVAAVVTAWTIVVVPAAAIQQKAWILRGLRDQPFEGSAMEGSWRQRLVVVVLPPPPPPTGWRRRDRCQPVTKIPPPDEGAAAAATFAVTSTTPTAISATPAVTVSWRH